MPQIKDEVTLNLPHAQNWKYYPEEIEPVATSGKYCVAVYRKFRLEFFSKQYKEFHKIIKTRPVMRNMKNGEIAIGST